MTPPDGLYEKDFYAWTQAQARELRAAAEARIDLPLDREFLAEEIESAGRVERNGVRQRVRLVLREFLRLAYTSAAPVGHGWRAGIIEARAELRDML